MAIIPAGFAQVNLIFAGGPLPHEAEVTFGMSNNGGTAPLTIAGTIAGLWAAHLRPVTSDAITLDRIKVKRGPNDTGAEATYAVATSGTKAGAVTSPNVTYLVRKVTDLGGKRNRGRVYYPCPTEAQTLEGGGLAVAAVNAMTTGWQDFLADLLSGGEQMAILHSSAPPAPTPVTAMFCESQVATQRRRLRG
jgi:hypothetical protein